jgi:hypothetical protein
MMDSTASETELTPQEELIARLEHLLTGVRNGHIVGVACVAITDAADYMPFWVTSEQCVHGGAVLRAAVSWLCTRMDADALRIALEQEREHNPRLS